MRCWKGPGGSVGILSGVECGRKQSGRTGHLAGCWRGALQSTFPRDRALREGMPTMSQAPDAPAPTQPTPHGQRPAAAGQVEASLVPESGWHFLHLFYRIDRGALGRLTESQRQQGREQLMRALDRSSAAGVEQMQCFAMVGHKADFGVMLAGPDLPALHAVQTAVQSSALGPALVPTYSFYSHHRGLGVRPRRRGVRPHPPRPRGDGPRGQPLPDEGQAVRQPARRDEPPSDVPRVPRLAASSASTR